MTSKRIPTTVRLSSIEAKRLESIRKAHELESTAQVIRFLIRQEWIALGGRPAHEGKS